MQWPGVEEYLVVRAKLSAPIGVAVLSGLLCLAPVARAQVVSQPSAAATIRVRVETESGSAISGAIVQIGVLAAETGLSGEALLHPPPGNVVVHARHIGSLPDSVRMFARADLDTTITVRLRSAPAPMSPITVLATRTERRVEDEPLRVEVLAGEDIGEKTQMRPADLRLLLTEMSGVRVQTTSPSLGAATVRIQGLRGRYTQILSDGLPLYGAQAGGFGLLQIPPLDLRQAEVIKGAASALYGPGAMGGVLNLVSRRATDTSEALLNGTANGGADGVAFVAKQLSRTTGLTVLGGVHGQRAVDVDQDQWADIPGFARVEARPRLFFADSTGRSFMITAGGFAERRAGGSTGGNVFPESLTTRHADVGATAQARLLGSWTANLRLAANHQDRTRIFGAQRERDATSTLFAEGSTTTVTGHHTLLVGAGWQREQYRNTDVADFDNIRATSALFAQYTYGPAAWLSTQVNGRCDVSSTYGTNCSPRVSLLGHAGRAVSARLSAGTGWFAPTAMTEETDEIGLTRVMPLSSLVPERARTASLDVTVIRGALEVTGTLFASRVTNAVGLRTVAGDTMGRVQFINATGPSTAYGGELFAVYNQEPIVVTAYYTRTHTHEISTQSGLGRESPYVPPETMGVDAAYEEDESGTRVGLEIFYTGPQTLDENPYRTTSPRFVTVGVLASQRLGRAMIYVNLENLTNIRQSQFDPLLRPTPGEGGRRTVDAWAPLEGRTINAGLRLRL